MLVAGPDSHAWADRHKLMAYWALSYYYVLLILAIACTVPPIEIFRYSQSLHHLS